MEPEDLAAPAVNDELPLARLVVIRGGIETDTEFLFAPPATIGRFDPSVGPIDVDLGDTPEGAYVSRRHAQIKFADGVWTLHDLGSSNGTYLRRDDFEKIEEAELADGSEIALGNARFVFRVGVADMTEPQAEDSLVEDEVAEEVSP